MTGKITYRSEAGAHAFLTVEETKYWYALQELNDFCDIDPRHPYYDVKKHSNGKSLFLSLRTQLWPKNTKANPYSGKPARANKKFFGKTRQEVTIKAAEYIREGKF